MNIPELRRFFDYYKAYSELYKLFTARSSGQKTSRLGIFFVGNCLSPHYLCSVRSSLENLAIIQQPYPRIRYLLVQYPNSA